MALATFSGISARAFSYAGLKDRHAVTDQWFCLHLPGKSDPDFTAFQLADCDILAVARSALFNQVVSQHSWGRRAC